MALNMLSGIPLPDPSRYDYTQAVKDAEVRQAIPRQNAARNALTQVLGAAGGDFSAINPVGIMQIDPEYGMAIQASQQKALADAEKARMERESAEITRQKTLAEAYKAQQEGAAKETDTARKRAFGEALRIGDIGAAAKIDPEAYKSVLENAKAFNQYRRDADKHIVNALSGATTPEEWDAAVGRMGEYHPDVFGPDIQKHYLGQFGQKDAILRAEMDNISIEDERAKAQAKSDIEAAQKRGLPQDEMGKITLDWQNAQKDPTNPAYGKTFEQYLAWIAKQKAAGAAKTTISMGDKREEASYGKALDSLEKGYEKLQNVPIEIAKADDALKILNEGTYAGAGGGLITTAKNWLTRAGVDTGDYDTLVRSGTLASVLESRVTEAIRAAFGGQLSEGERASMKLALGSIDTNPDSLRTIINIYKAHAARKALNHNGRLADLDRQSATDNSIFRINLPGLDKEGAVEGEMRRDKDSGLVVVFKNGEWREVLK